MKRRVIIDCDPGVDDALAISALLACDDIDVLAITTMNGNRPQQYTLVNALRLTDFFEKSIPVYKGEEQLEVDPDIKSSFFHGVNGFGDVEIPYSERNLQKESAAEYLRRVLKENPKQIEVVALGPLTNLAALFLQDREAFGAIKAIYSMGGTFTMGNITPHCEFNYYFDLKSTEVVMEAVEKCNVDFHMFPLDITMKVYFDMNEFQLLQFEGGKWGKLVNEIFRSSYLPKTWGQIRLMGCILHDLVAAMYLICPQVYDEAQPISVAVSRKTDTKGKLLKESDGGHVYVHKDIDASAMKKEYIALLFGKETEEKYQLMLDNYGVFANWK